MLSMLTVEGWGIQMVMMLLMQAAVGWVVARTHRAYQVPFVFLFLICDVLWYAQQRFKPRAIVDLVRRRVGLREGRILVVLLRRGFGHTAP